MKKPKKLFFTRHGKTAYTGEFPDLTPEGIAQAFQVAGQIADIIARFNTTDVSIISSPLPRALGTASIIASKIEYPQQAIKHEPAIRCMDFYNPEQAEMIWKSFGSARAVDIAYSDDPRFEQGFIVEKRSAIQRRFYRYLGELFERFISDDLPDVMIHTTHYEVLWQIALKAINRHNVESPPLSHCELIQLDLEEVRGLQVRTHITFRGFTDMMCFKLPSTLFGDQF
ncbi:MAG: hypothetical protein RIT04_502 [Candidatus Parcubacteria bacterium]